MRKTKTESHRWETTRSMRLRVIVPTTEPSSPPPFAGSPP